MSVFNTELYTVVCNTQWNIAFRDLCTKHFLIIGREVLILTLYLLLALQGCISWYIPRDGLMMREWPYTASNRDELGCTPPLTSRFPSALEMSLGLRPREISRSSGMYNPIHPSSRQCTYTILCPMLCNAMRYTLSNTIQYFVQFWGAAYLHPFLLYSFICFYINPFSLKCDYLYDWKIMKICVDVNWWPSWSWYVVQYLQ